MADPRPWQYSEAIGGDFIYVQSRDLIVKRDGGRFPRPPTIPRTHSLLQAAVWEGADSPGVYAARPAQSRASEDVIPRFPGGRSTTSDLASSMNAMNLNPRPQDPRFVDRGDPRLGTLARTARGPPGAQLDPHLRELGVPGHMTLLETDGDTERLDPSYKKRPAKFFTEGRVFMTLWPETAGENNSHITSLLPDAGVYRGAYGERFYTKVRRFVVIRTSDKYCSVLPITTYNGRGVSKPGVIKSDHAIVYTGRTCPHPRPEEYPARREAPMRPESICVDPDDKSTKLDSMSRLDFGKVDTIQHYVKAKSFGKVNERSLRPLLHQFDNVWRKHSDHIITRESSATSPSAFSSGSMQSWKAALLEKGFTEDEVKSKLLAMYHQRAASLEDEEDDDNDDEDQDADDDDDEGEARHRGEEPEEEDLYGPG
ncbi:hypothetical protein B0A48_17653 [Cryoendolithus antarcticus]|uniref:DUF6590 domain-containing protein n=1 Tax=Cryoendolithus antarcticus TaxID=1507870 RepID=A0A1V8SC48_9PEZI|nr:hypothetical protein B0A48_17653 [Cryoendolithus antarcticus]